MALISLSKRLASRLYEYLREAVWYARHLVSGTSYAEYYADRMNRIVTRNPDWGLNLNRRFQLEYLKARGLVPQSTLLDYGCGALAAGIHFIGYLDPDKYVGLDISREVLREGERRLDRIGLTSRQPNLRLLDGDLVAVLGERQFDFIWAQSVLTHMPPEDILILLRDIRQHMHGRSQLFTTFAHTKGKPRQKQFKDWYYNREFFIQAAATYGFDVEFMSDWNHPDDPAGNDMMARFTLKGSR